MKDTVEIAREFKATYRKLIYDIAKSLKLDILIDWLNTKISK